jgi:hypothetical protein
VKKRQQKKDRERILGLLSGVEGRAFLAKGVAKSTDAKRQKKGGLERFFKSWMPSIFV